MSFINIVDYEARVNDMERLKKISKYLGLHPLVGGGMIAVDWMLFGGEASSFGVSWPVSLVVGFLLIVPCLLVQRYSYGDDWPGAVGKSLIVGVITAIPTAIPSIGTGILTVLGFPKLFRNQDQDSGES